MYNSKSFAEVVINVEPQGRQKHHLQPIRQGQIERQLGLHPLAHQRHPFGGRQVHPWCWVRP